MIVASCIVRRRNSPCGPCPSVAAPLGCPRRESPSSRSPQTPPPADELTILPLHMILRICLLALGVVNLWDAHLSDAAGAAHSGSQHNLWNILQLICTSITPLFQVVSCYSDRSPRRPCPATLLHLHRRSQPRLLPSPSCARPETPLSDPKVLNDDFKEVKKSKYVCTSRGARRATSKRSWGRLNSSIRQSIIDPSFMHKIYKMVHLTLRAIPQVCIGLPRVSGKQG